jgi:hypothetical protein
MKESLKTALAKGQTKQVIAALCTLTVQDADLQRQAIHLSARYAEYERQKLGNLENASVLGIELNKINQTTLAIIETLDEAMLASAPKAVIEALEVQTPDAATAKTNWPKWAGIIVAVFAFLASIAEFSGYSLKDIISTDSGKKEETVAIPDSVLIKGIVRDAEGIVLSQVKVSVENQSVMCDDNGYFELKTKVHTDGTNYPINLSKAGFEPLNLTSTGSGDLGQYMLKKK